MTKKEILVGLGLSLFVGVILSPFASPHPDGLERVAEDLGFIDSASEKPISPEVLPDYTVPGIQNESLSTALAGGLGTLILYFGGFGLAKLLARSRSRAHQQPHT
jgi:cobalt/nickel transport protein